MTTTKPSPQEGESESDFVARCIPIVLEDGSAEDQSQAAAMCHSMYSSGKPTTASRAISKHYAAKDLTVDLDKRTVKHFITTTSIDDDGEVVLPRGAILTRFLKNRTVFDVHEYGTRNVVGKNLELDVTDKGIIALTRFTPRPPSLPKSQEWFPDTALWLHHTGDINGWSIGFEPVESRQPTAKDKAEFGEAEHFQLVHSRWRMLEYSQAPLPANEDAINLCRRKGFVSDRLAKHLSKGDRLTMQLARSFKRKTQRVVKTVVVLRQPKPKPRGPSLQERIEQEIERAVAKEYGKLYT